MTTLTKHFNIRDYFEKNVQSKIILKFWYIKRLLWSL